MQSDLQILDQYISRLAAARDSFLALHSEMVEAHPDWIRRGDTRSNLLAKPVNLILVAVVNLRLTQAALLNPEFWKAGVGIEVRLPESIGAPLHEQNAFYRVAFFQLLFANLEHGLRAMEPHVSGRSETYSQRAFARVYPAVFRAALPVEVACKHIELFDLLRCLRNTVHNNGVYQPHDGRDRTFNVSSHRFELVVGRRAEYFGWNHIIDLLSPLHTSLNDLLKSPVVTSPFYIPDIASHD